MFAPRWIDPAQLQSLSGQEWRKRFFEPKTEQVLKNKTHQLTELLKAVFLHTPASAAPSIAPITVERTELRADEVAAYNVVLSLHQRDVLRSTQQRVPPQPDEWHRTRPSDGWYREKKRNDQHPPPPCGEKTIGELMRTANGGECFSLKPAVEDVELPESIRQAISAISKPGGEVDMPTCAKCDVAVPGLLTLPCNCDGAICGECFKAYKCDEFDLKKTSGKGYKKCPFGCRRKQSKRVAWAPQQPRLLLETDEDRMQALFAKKSREKIREMEAEQRREQKKRKEEQPGEGSSRREKSQKVQKVDALLRKQPPPRQLFAPLGLRVLSSVSNRSLEKGTTQIRGAGGKLVYLAEQLRDLAKEGGAKVLLTPPANVGVRARFVEALGELIGSHSLADLNVKKIDQGKQLLKFRRGYGRYWQCRKCGADHEDSTPRCETATVGVKLADAGKNDALTLRHIDDVEKEEKEGEDNTIYAGSKVSVFRPGTERLVGRGEVQAIGRCNGKPPSEESGGYRAAPPGSCFVLVLNPQCMEGLDLPQATHLYQVEPILRADKEAQAQARGQRLGGERKLQIVQLLVGGTIEEQQWYDLKEIRRAGMGPKRPKPAEHEGGQARMLNELKLLRPDPTASSASEDDGEYGEEEVVAEMEMEKVEAEEEEAEAEAEEEVMVDDEAEGGGDAVSPAPTSNGRAEQDGGAGSSHDEELARAHAREEARRAAKTLLAAEDEIPIAHVSRAFQVELRAWRRQVRKAPTVGRVAIQMITLRHGMLEGRFHAGWAKGGAQYNAWVQAVQAPHRSAASLEDLIQQLQGSYDAEQEIVEIVESTPARSEQPLANEQNQQPVAGSSTQRSDGKRKRAPATDVDEPRTAKTEAPAPTERPAWRKLAVQLLLKGKVSSAAIATAIMDMASKHGETVDVYSLYEDDLGLDATRINDLVIAMGP